MNLRTLNNKAAKLAALLEDRDGLTASLKAIDKEIAALVETLTEATGNGSTTGTWYTGTTPNLRVEVPVTYAVTDPEEAAMSLGGMAGAVLTQEWKFHRSGMLSIQRAGMLPPSWEETYLTRKLGKARVTVVPEAS